jgi:DNA-directed RNA polymerase subunit RPC12/RpoP
MEKVKNQCASCGKDFVNSFVHYEEKGNYCNDCCSKVDHMMQWRSLKHSTIKISKKQRETMTEDQIEEMIHEKTNILKEDLCDLGNKIKQNWGIDMEENDKDFQDFKSYFYSNV